MGSHRFVAIIPKAYRDGLNQDALAFDKGGGKKTASVPLYDERGALTHYWFSASVSDETWKAVLALAGSKYPLARVEEWDMDRRPGLPNELLEGMKLRRGDATP